MTFEEEVLFSGDLRDAVSVSADGGGRVTDQGTGFLLKRAQEEAVAAIRADDPADAVAHQHLSILFSAQAILRLKGGEPMPSHLVVE